MRITLIAIGLLFTCLTGNSQSTKLFLSESGFQYFNGENWQAGFPDNPLEIIEFESHLTLSEIPKNLSKCDNLEIIKIGEYNNIYGESKTEIVIPDYIFEFKKLKTLSIENQNITKLSSSISKLTQLEILNLTGNSIIELPKEISSLPLKELFVGDNLLTSLPSNFNALSGTLEKLELSANRFTKNSISFDVKLLTQLATCLHTDPLADPTFKEKHLKL